MRLHGRQFQDLITESIHPLSGQNWTHLQFTEEELAILLSEEIEKEPTAEELKLLVPGYETRILAGVLARIEEHEQA